VKERYEWSDGGGIKAGGCRQLRLSAVADAMADKADCGLRICRAGFAVFVAVKFMTAFQAVVCCFLPKAAAMPPRRADKTRPKDNWQLRPKLKLIKVN